MRCLRADAVERLRKAFKSHGVELETCCPWADAKETVRRLAAADLVIGPHGAGLANGLLARRGLVLVEIHGEFGGELDLFRRVADARARGGATRRPGFGATLRGELVSSTRVPPRRVTDTPQAGGYVSVRGAGSGGGGMTLSDAQAARAAACAAGLWRDGSAARRRNATTRTSPGTREACGRVGPDPGARRRRGRAPFGAAFRPEGRRRF